VADLDGVDAERVYREARDRGIEVTPLGMYYMRGEKANGLLLGFASTRPNDLRCGMEKLAVSIESARRPA
jgi:DNA-binding transcriptional MocR family regulator